MTIAKMFLKSNKTLIYPQIWLQKEENKICVHPERILSGASASFHLPPSQSRLLPISMISSILFGMSWNLESPCHNKSIVYSPVATISWKNYQLPHLIP